MALPEPIVPGTPNPDIASLPAYPALARIIASNTVGTTNANKQHKSLEKRTDTLCEKINALITYLEANPILAASSLLTTTGTNTADLNANSHKITGTAEGTAPSDVAIVGQTLTTKGLNGANLDANSCRISNVAAGVASSDVAIVGQLGQLGQLSSVPVGTIVATIWQTAPDGWVYCDGSLVSLDTYPLLEPLLRTDTLRGVIDHEGVLSVSEQPIGGLCVGRILRFGITGFEYYELIKITEKTNNVTYKTDCIGSGVRLITNDSSGYGTYMGYFGDPGDNWYNKIATLPDLRGEFIRGWSTGRPGVDDGRAFGSAQSDEIREHRHGTYTKQMYSNDITSGYTYTPDVIGNPTGLYGGAETRPRNVALKYYMKAS